jgi:hypothetical protein
MVTNTENSVEWFFDDPTLTIRRENNKESYTQVKLEYVPLDNNKRVIDTVWIPTKFAEVGKIIILDRPSKHSAKVISVFNTKQKSQIEKKTWNNNI